MWFITFKAYFEFFESAEEEVCSLKFGACAAFYTCEKSSDTEHIQKYFSIP